MVFGKTTQEYTDSFLECIAKIRVQIGIEFGLPQFCAALQVGIKLTLEELLERLNAYTVVNETKNSTKSNSSGVVEENDSVANFATRGRVMNEHEPG